MAQEFITIKIWRKTRKLAKELALQSDMSLSEFLDKLLVEESGKKHESKNQTAKSEN